MLNKNIAAHIKPLAPIATDLAPRGELKEKIKGVLFDIYGTLFISGSGDISITRKDARLTQELEALINKNSISRSANILIKEFFDAIKTQHEKMKKDGTEYPEVEIDKIWMKVLQTQDQEMARAFAEEYELLVNPIYPMPHVRELLSGLKNKNICMGIISNAQFYTPYLFEWFLNSDLKGLGFQDDLIAYSFRFGCAKPSLSMFRHVADRLARMSIKPGSVLYLGNDMLNDIYPAATIGFQTALFAGDARSLRLRADNPLCRSLKPDFVVTDLIQVLDFV